MSSAKTASKPKLDRSALPAWLMPAEFKSYGEMVRHYGTADKKGNGVWLVRDQKNRIPRLFVDIRFHPKGELKTIWEASFGPLPGGQEVKFLVSPAEAGRQGTPIVGIIAILIGLKQPTAIMGFMHMAAGTQDA